MMGIDLQPAVEDKCERGSCAGLWTTLSVPTVKSMKGVSAVILTVTLVGVVGGALGEDRGDHEPLERKRHPAPTRELRTTPERRGLSDRDDAPGSDLDEQPSPKHGKSDGRGDRSHKDDDDDE
jgi:hypothetical protein